MQTLFLHWPWRIGLVWMLSSVCCKPAIISLPRALHDRLSLLLLVSILNINCLQNIMDTISSMFMIQTFMYIRTFQERITILPQRKKNPKNSYFAQMEKKNSVICCFVFLLINAFILLIFRIFVPLMSPIPIGKWFSIFLSSNLTIYLIQKICENVVKF